MFGRNYSSVIVEYGRLCSPESPHDMTRASSFYLLSKLSPATVLLFSPSRALIAAPAETIPVVLDALLRHFLCLKSKRCFRNPRPPSEVKSGHEIEILGRVEHSANGRRMRRRRGKCNFSPPLLSFGKEDVMVRKRGDGGRGRHGQIRVGAEVAHITLWGFEVNKYKISALLFWLLLLERGEEEEELNRRRGGGGGG